MRRAWGTLAILIPGAMLSGCISSVETPMQRDALSPERPIVLMVFVSPGPVMDESNANMEQAAKVIPGLGFVYGAQANERNLQASRDLAGHLPPWQPSQLFEPALRTELARAQLPGKLVTAVEVGLTDADLNRLNEAGDIIDWQRRYMVPQPDNSGLPPPRAYSTISSLRDAVILEVNFAYGAPSDGKGQWTPTLSFVAKLIRGSDNAELWRHEDQAQDTGGLKPEQDYLRQPTDLINRYQALAPTLARALSDSIQKSLREANSAPALPTPSPH